MLNKLFGRKKKEDQQEEITRLENRLNCLEGKHVSIYTPYRIGGNNPQFVFGNMPTGIRPTTAATVVYECCKHCKKTLGEYTKKEEL